MAATAQLEAFAKRIAAYRHDPVAFCREVLDLEPHVGQQTWLEKSTNRENALTTGNRYGKSHIAAAKAIIKCAYRIGWTPEQRARYAKAHENYHAINVSYSADQSKLVWYKAHGMLQSPKAQWLVRDVKLTPFPRIEFINGAIFEARSTGGNGARLLGNSYDHVNWDEAALEKKFELIRDNVLRMRLVDRAGTMDYTSTGQGRNAFGLYFLTGLPGPKKDPRLYSQTGSTLENPNIDQESVQENAARMSDKMRAQNIEGAIIDGGGDYFDADALDACHDEALDDLLRIIAVDNEEEIAWAQLYPDTDVPWRMRYPSHRYVHGWDLADKQDWTVGFTVDVSTTPGTIVEFERFHRTGWPHVYARIRDRQRRYGGLTGIDNTGLGDVVESDLADIRPIGINFAGGHKDELLTNLRTAIGLRQLRWPIIKPFADEVSFYQRDDAGLRKDCVMALAVAAWVARRGIGNVPASTIR